MLWNKNSSQTKDQAGEWLSHGNITLLTSSSRGPLFCQMCILHNKWMDFPNSPWGFALSLGSSKGNAEKGYEPHIELDVAQTGEREPDREKEPQDVTKHFLAWERTHWDCSLKSGLCAFAYVHVSDCISQCKALKLFSESTFALFIQFFFPGNFLTYEIILLNSSCTDS